MYSKSLIDKQLQLGWSSKKLAEMADVPHSAVLRMIKGVGFWEDYATKLEKTLTKALTKAIKTAEYEKALRDLTSQPPKEKTPKWSLNYKRCAICGTIKRKHVAKGLCTKCYQLENENRQKKYVLRKDGSASHKLSYLYLVEQYVIKEKSLGDIAKECACSRQFVYKKLKSNNIPSRGKSSARKLALKRHKLSFERIDQNGQKRSVTLRKINVDENFFSSWSPEMAWVLGLIFSDGNLFVDKGNNARISIAQKETELLDKVKILMNCNARLYHSPRKVYDDVVSGELYTLQIQDKKIFSDLISLGLVENKSLTVDFPNIPKEYVRHFIRGCWDGDGSVFLERGKGLSARIRTSFVSGSLSFIKGMLYELEKAGLKKRNIYTSTYKRKNPSYSFKINKPECEKLYHYLYENVPAEQYLERKYNVFKSYFGPC